MFRQSVSNTALISPEANSFFNRINGESFQYDNSFIATLRALLANRMPETDNIYFGYLTGGYTSDRIGSTEAVRMVRNIVNAEDIGDGYVYVYSLTSYQQDNYAALELLNSTFTVAYPEWHQLDNIREFYRRQFYTICFIHPEKKSVLIFVDSLDLKKFHFLQCSIPAILPWYFSKEAGLQEIELNLIKSLREKSPQNYLSILAEIAKQYDFRTMRIKNLLAGFETRYERQQCENVKRDIDTYNRYINDLRSQFDDYMRSIRDLQIKLLGLETKISNDTEDSEIMDYFLCNKCINLESVNDEEMRFVTRTYLEFFDEDMAQRVISNEHSYIYEPNGRRCNNYILAEDMKKLMTAIFIDQTMRIKFCAAYKLRLAGHAEGLSSFGYSDEYIDCMPNTHIDRFACLGSYERHINEALREHNYIGAIEQCISSSKSLNFGDSMVMKVFISRFYGLESGYSDRKFIELPDGTSVTPKEAVEWLKAQEVSADE